MDEIFIILSPHSWNLWTFLIKFLNFRLLFRVFHIALGGFPLIGWFTRSSRTTTDLERRRKAARPQSPMGLIRGFASTEVADVPTTETNANSSKRYDQVQPLNGPTKAEE
jgi:hypothetical protein